MSRLHQRRPFTARRVLSWQSTRLGLVGARDRLVAEALVSSTPARTRMRSSTTRDTGPTLTLGARVACQLERPRMLSPRRAAV